MRRLNCLGHILLRKQTSTDVESSFYDQARFECQEMRQSFLYSIYLPRLIIDKVQLNCYLIYLRTSKISTWRCCFKLEPLWRAFSAKLLDNILGGIYENSGRLFGRVFHTPVLIDFNLPQNSWVLPWLNENHRINFDKNFNLHFIQN